MGAYEAINLASVFPHPLHPPQAVFQTQHTMRAIFTTAGLFLSISAIPAIPIALSSVLHRTLQTGKSNVSGRWTSKDVQALM
jgi:hypothetical protein